MQDKARIIELVSKVCELSKDVLEKPPSSAMAKILRRQISNIEKTRLLFRLFVADFSYQATSDQAVDRFRERNGDVTFQQVALQMEIARRNRSSFCPKLESFESFKGCCYRKAPRTCNSPTLISACPLPKFVLIKGSTNIKTISFFLWLSDICQGDLISFTDNVIGRYANLPTEDERITGAKDELIELAMLIHGVGSKLANMVLSSFLLSNTRKENWLNIGRSMVPVDSLVHNFLHRTGILRFYNSAHPYGPACYVKCIKIIEDLAREINCTKFSEAYPSFFPRFISFSIWRFSSVGLLDVCNGKNIRKGRCRQNDVCPVYDLCDRVRLK